MFFAPQLLFGQYFLFLVYTSNAYPLSFLFVPYTSKVKREVVHADFKAKKILSRQ